MSYVLLALGGNVLNALVVFGVLLAIFNGNIAIMLYYGRILYRNRRVKPRGFSPDSYPHFWEVA